MRGSSDGDEWVDVYGLEVGGSGQHDCGGLYGVA